MKHLLFGALLLCVAGASHAQGVKPKQLDNIPDGHVIVGGADGAGDNGNTTVDLSQYADTAVYNVEGARGVFRQAVLKDSISLVQKLREGKALLPALTFNTISEVTPPAGSGYSLPFKVFRSNDGNRYTTDVDETEAFRSKFAIRTTPPNTYYVDACHGSDTETGLTKSTALKSIGAAFAKTGVRTIYVRGGCDYFRDQNNFYTTSRPADSVNIIGYEGRPRMGAIQGPLTWSKTTGRNCVYQATRSAVAYVLNRKKRNEYGAMPELREVADIGQCDSIPNSFFYSSPTLYVHLEGCETPNQLDDIAVVLTGRVEPVNIDAEYVYLENLEIFGQVEAESSVAGSTLVMRDVDVFYADQTSNAVELKGPDLIAYGCRVYKSGVDGINYHVFSGNISNGYEVDCSVAGHGQEDASHQASTMHDGGAIFRLNGAYYSAAQNSIGDVNTGTKSWNVNISLVGDAFPARESHSAFFSNATAWLERVKMGGNHDYQLGAYASDIYLLDTYPLSIIDATANYFFYGY